MMNERGKSDPAVVAAKLANKAERSAAEPVEPRAGTKGNANQQHTGRTQSRETVSQVSEAIAPSLDFSELRARAVDLVLARLVSPLVHGQSLDDLNVEVLFEDKAVIAVGAKSRWARRRNLKLADLVNEP